MEFYERLKVYPLGRKKHYEVYVAKTRAQMYQICAQLAKEINVNNRPYRFEGITHTWTCLVGAPKRLRKVMGIICLHRQHLTDEVVSHEMTHAALHVVGPRGRRNQRRWEEKVCRIQGDLVQQFWSTWRKHAKISA